MATKRKMTQDASVVIYWSDDDTAWIAHSLFTDQVGTGERVVDALADLIAAMNAVYEAAKEDSSIALFRRAPKEVFAMAKKAKALPMEVYEVAYRMVHGEWPANVVIEVDPDEPKRPLFKTKLELVGG